MVSPLRRATETAKHAFSWAVPAVAAGAAAGGGDKAEEGKGAAGAQAARVPFVALEALREQHGVHLCDRRVSKAALKVAYGDFVDYSKLEAEEDPWFDPWRRESKISLAKRCHAALQWLAQREEKEVAIVTHSSWLHAMFSIVLRREEAEKAQAVAAAASEKGRAGGGGGGGGAAKEGGVGGAQAGGAEEAETATEVHVDGVGPPWFSTGEMRSVCLSFVKEL